MSLPIIFQRSLSAFARPMMSTLSRPSVGVARAGVLGLASQPTNWLVQQTRGMKVRTSVKKYCSDCYIVRRKGRVYVYCKTNKKHKQRQG